ncbi:hypothetical protein P4Z41_30000 [Bacillus thuringiensis]|nr:hypothetical protein [Bacillus thuringiensis]
MRYIVQVDDKYNKEVRYVREIEYLQGKVSRVFLTRLMEYANVFTASTRTSADENILSIYDWLNKLSEYEIKCSEIPVEVTPKI